MQKRAVIYIRVEDFVASFEEARRTDLKGAPFVVCAPDANKGARGVVVVASRVAKRQGIAPDMTIKKATEILPGLVLLPFDAPSYEKESRRFFDLVYGYSPLVESFGLDAAFIEPVANGERTDIAVELCKELRARVKALLGLSTRAGIGANKLLAKVAFDLCGPNSVNVIREGGEKAVLEPLSARSLPGVGPGMMAGLKSIEATTVGQLSALPRRFLEAKLGKAEGAMLHDFSHGRESSEVVPFAKPGAFLKEAIFETGVLDRSVVKEALFALTSEAVGRLKEDYSKCKAVAIKLGYADLKTIATAIDLLEPSDSLNDIKGSVALLFDKTETGRAVVLVGVRLE